MKVMKMIEANVKKDENGIEYITVEPEWKNFPTWFHCIQQMLEGHNKKCKEMIKISGKKSNYKDRFEYCKIFAREEQSFWKAIEELACKEVYEMEAAQERGELDD
jgi:hypothetical protein